MQLKTHYGIWELPSFHQWSERSEKYLANRKKLLGPESTVATIGSCFAEELASSITRFGAKGSLHPAGRFYNSSSIRQELERIFATEDSFFEEPWEGQGVFFHPTLGPGEAFESVEKLQERCQQIDVDSRRLFRNADLIIVTLGLIEIWEEADTGRVLRQIPHPQVFPDLALKFRRLETLEVLADLERIRSLVKEFTGAKLVVTVSPVPLHSTFTDLDVRIANSESKARIRAAVSEFVDRYKDVAYFHSYELVNSAETMSDFMMADGRHVHRHAVDYIVKNFLDQYGEGFSEMGPVRAPQWLTRPGDSAWVKPLRQLLPIGHELLGRVKRKLRSFLNARA